jgi:ABC-2 type transport system ATP-binding protein
MVGKLTHLPTPRSPPDGGLLEQFDLAAADHCGPSRAACAAPRLAAALVHHPPVLFLDGATTGLDPQGRLDLWNDRGQSRRVSPYCSPRNASKRSIASRTTSWSSPRSGDRLRHVSRIEVRLGATVIDVVLRSSSDTERAPRAYRRRRRRSTAECHVPSLTAMDQAMLETVRRLDGARLDPVSLVLREPTLDDVFLELTGTSPTTSR